MAEIHQESINEIRKILGTPSPDAMAWNGMTMTERRVVVRVASLPCEVSGRSWAELTGLERGRIKAAAGRIRDWSEKLSGL